MKRKIYIIARDEYMHCRPGMDAFIGTWRELLLWLNGVGVLEEAGWAGGEAYREPLWEDEADKPSEFPWQYWYDVPDAALVKLFDDANGDGQQYVMVFDVEEGKQVLG